MSAKVADEGLSEEAFGVLRTAVNLARDQHIQKVAVLRLRLMQAHPQVQEGVIDSALRFWANRLVATEAT